MALPHNLDKNLHESKNFRNFCEIDGQISLELGFNTSVNPHDQSQHPPYIPPFHVAGFAPGPMQIDGSDNGADFEWKYTRKTIQEKEYLENNPQISTIEFWEAQPVSTGLGLSLDNARIASSSSDGSSLLSLVGDDIDRELQRQDAEIDSFLKIKGDQLRQAILDKIQKSQHKTISLMEERAIHQLREKDEELETINRKNKELEAQIEQLTIEAEAWQQRANMIAAYNYDLERAYYGRSKESIEGCGDSEVDDTASCFNGRVNRDARKKKMMMCKCCGVKEVCMVLLPCKHMCLCKDCERKLSSCPLCQSSKFIGMEVYM